MTCKRIKTFIICGVRWCLLGNLACCGKLRCLECKIVQCAKASGKVWITKQRINVIIERNMYLFPAFKPPPARALFQDLALILGVFTTFPRWLVLWVRAGAAPGHHTRLRLVREAAANSRSNSSVTTTMMLCLSLSLSLSLASGSRHDNDRRRTATRGEDVGGKQQRRQRRRRRCLLQEQQEAAATATATATATTTTKTATAVAATTIIIIVITIIVIIIIITMSQTTAHRALLVRKNARRIG